jgi:tetratricopeptide (TPR) repeat protein
MLKTIAVLLFSFLALTPGHLPADQKETVSLGDYKKGLMLYQQGFYEQALERFQLAIDGNWEFWQSYQMVGYCYFELRDKENALHAFSESLKINPDNPKLQKIVKDLKTGKLDVPLRPLEAEAKPIGTPVNIQAY